MTQRTFLPNRTHVPGTNGSTGQPRRIPHQRRPTVDPALVHRPVAHDVLPTAWRQVADSRFQVDVRWPEEPRLFRPDDGLHSPLIIAETMRQSAILLTHTAFGVPLDHRFVLQDLRYTVGRDFLPVNGATNDVAVEVACSAVRGGRRPTGMHCRVTLRRGTAWAEGEGELGITSPAAYRRIRGERATAELPHQPRPMAPGTVRCATAEQVLLAPPAAENRWQLRVDPHHPDLTNDHFPGILLMEACRQAACAATASEAFHPLVFSVRFLRYAEFSTPCWVEARPQQGSSDVLVTCHQDGEPVFLAHMATEEDPAGR
ncbi:ScbA/BarX family gamma-butyrolactone biosynthesis protein [Streptomyces sp. NBC_00212]|uniref:ScbA/BarX family gamma-butyrolactone biosynthesis protein n=1 Tax=Streptomyces sp. NBC_00212 TaxID=2975684 RepID=UPI002F9144FE